MKVVVIGGTGHVGTYLVPRLVEAGYEVTVVSRSKRDPYQPDPAWASVTKVVIDRTESEKKGTFGKEIRRLEPEVVIDMICFTPESAQQIVEGLSGQVKHFLHCGTIWVHGHSVEVPTKETQPRNPFGDYGIKKAAIEKYLLKEAREHDFPVTLLHPGHIVGPGWLPVNPAGHFNFDVFQKLAEGEKLLLPNIGMETLHHVHADDVAQSFMRALHHWEQANGQCFHVVSEAALTLRGYAESIAKWFGKPARLEFLPWDDWKKTISTEEANATWGHIAHSPNCSIQKAKDMIGYKPRFSSLDAVKEAVSWWMEHEKG